MHEAALVSVLEALRHRAREPQSLLRWNPLRLGTNALFQVASRRKRHRVEGLTLTLAILEHRHDVRVKQPRCRPHLVHESRHAVPVARKLPRQNLETDLPAQPLVHRAIHIRHATPAEKTEDPVVPEDGAGLQAHLRVWFLREVRRQEITHGHRYWIRFPEGVDES